MRSTRAPWIAGVLALALCMPAIAQVPAEAPPAPAHVANDAPPSCGQRLPGDTRPRIGLALGGGGARGIAHVSVLREIERLHVPVDCIAGTSMGALVGGLYASGMSVDDMESLVRSTDWKRLFDDSLERKERSYRRKQDDRDGLATVGVGIGKDKLKFSAGMLQGERILGMFERSTLGVSEVDDFDKLPIPYRAVATDLNTGEAVVLGRGSLAMAMRASMSLPGVFQPIDIDGRVLLDGGIANQVPIDVVRAMGADIVIAVDVGTPLVIHDRDASLLEVVSQLTGMLTVGNTRRSLATLGEGDILIVPALGTEVATSAFDKAPEALAIGAAAAEQARPRLAHLSVTPEAYLAAKQRRPLPNPDSPIVQFVRLDNDTAYDDEYILSRLDIDVGEPLDPDRLENRLLRVYSLGTLASITYDVVREGDRSGIVIHARPKPHGPNYLQLGVRMNTDFQGTYESNIRAAILISPVSRYGAEARFGVTLGSEPALSAEYYHPFDMANRYLMYARAGYANPNIHVFDDAGNNTANYDLRSLVGDLHFAREYGNYGTAGLGLQRASGRAVVETGDPSLQDFDFDSGRVYLFANVDRLDSVYFPRDGYGAQIDVTAARGWLGSDSDYTQFNFEAIGAKSFDRHSVQGGVSFHTTFEGELPVQDRYRLGGRGKLVGYRPNERTGQQYAVVYTGYTYQLAEVFGRSALVGGTLEYGNAWERRSQMAWGDGLWNGSVYLGFDSWIGPMLFGYGMREGGEGVLFIEIGQPF